jgi:2-dehydro-3-deoxy-L-rhamnonate dehydrogenase (NAD+)
VTDAVTTVNKLPASNDFNGTVAVIAGGGGGIGREIVARLEASKATVWTWDLAPPAGDRQREVDVTDIRQVASAVEEVITRDGRIDVLVNCAGILGSYLPFDQISEAEWLAVVKANLVGVMQVCSHVVPHMRRAGRGRIVNLGSLAAKQGLANLAAYSAASGGVVAFTKALAQELIEDGVLVNCVAPGPIDTTLITDLGAPVVETMIASSPMKRLGVPAEVAEIVVWLCSDACTFSTGAVYDVSGGRAAY